MVGCFFLGGGGKGLLCAAVTLGNCQALDKFVYVKGGVEMNQEKRKERKHNKMKLLPGFRKFRDSGN